MQDTFRASKRPIGLITNLISLNLIISDGSIKFEMDLIEITALQLLRPKYRTLYVSKYVCK